MALHTPIVTKHSLEADLFKLNRLGWSAYVFLKYLSLEESSPELEGMKKSIWDTLAPEIQAKIRGIRKLAK